MQKCEQCNSSFSGVHYLNPFGLHIGLFNVKNVGQYIILFFLQE